VYKVVNTFQDKNKNMQIGPLFNYCRQPFVKGLNIAETVPVKYYPQPRVDSFNYYTSGYHCFIKKEDAELYNAFIYGNEGIVVKFKIPAGTEVLRGTSDMFASNKKRHLYTLVSPVLIME